MTRSKLNLHSRIDAHVGRRTLLKTAGAAAASSLLYSANVFAADAYPARPIKFIIPFTPGSLGDVFMRPVCDAVSQQIGQPIVIDNRAGASSAIGAELAAHSAPDGYTIFMGTQSALILNRIARKKLPYDALTDFTPITMLFAAPMFLYINNDLPVKTVPELIAYAKARPGKLNFGSIGPGTSPHVIAEMFKTATGVDLVHIPYKGAIEANTGLATNEIQVYFNGGNTMSVVDQGKARVLASGGLKRSALRPDLPTIAEAAGIPDFELLPWFALFGPANLPRPIVDRLRQEFIAQLNTPAAAQKATFLNIEIITSTPEAITERMKAEIPKMTKILRDAGFQPE